MKLRRCGRLLSPLAAVQAPGKGNSDSLMTAKSGLIRINSGLDKRSQQADNRATLDGL